MHLRSIWSSWSSSSWRSVACRIFTEFMEMFLLPFLLEIFVATMLLYESPIVLDTWWKFRSLLLVKEYPSGLSNCQLRAIRCSVWRVHIPYTQLVLALFLISRTSSAFWKSQSEEWPLNSSSASIRIYFDIYLSEAHPSGPTLNRISKAIWRKRAMIIWVLK